MERWKEEAAREKERKRREQLIAKTEMALEQAKREHETKVQKIEKDRAALDRRSQAENARWEKQRGKLETALRRARGLEIRDSASAENLSWAAVSRVILNDPA